MLSFFHFSCIPLFLSSHTPLFLLSHTLYSSPLILLPSSPLILLYSSSLILLSSSPSIPILSLHSSHISLPLAVIKVISSQVTDGLLPPLPLLRAIAATLLSAANHPFGGRFVRSVGTILLAQAEAVCGYGKTVQDEGNR